MWVSNSILKSSGFARTKAFRYIWSTTFLLPSLPDYNNPTRLHSGSRHYASSTGVCSCKPFGEDSLKRIEVSDACVETIRSVLVKHGWINRFDSVFSIELDEYKVIRILDDLFAETNDASIALYFFKWSELWIGAEHSTRSICRMIHILVSGNMNYRAVDMLLHLVKRSHGVCLVMNDLFETRGDRKVLETVFSMLVDSCVKERKVDIAMKLAYKMDQLGIFPSRGVCISLLKEILRIHGLELAREFVEHMISRGRHLNAAVISLFISKHCSDGSFDKAWELLMEMKQQYGIKPDIVAFTVFIDRLCKAGFLKEATSVLFNLKLFGISQDSVSVSCVIDGFCKAGKPEEAVKLIHYFRLRPNIFVYSSFLSKICGEGDMLKACTVFQEIFELGLLPDCVCYTTMIGGYCKLGKIDKAFQYFGAMLTSGNSPSLTTYTLLIGGCSKFGNVGDAETLFRNMKLEGLVPDVVAYNNLMHGYGKSHQLNKVFELMDGMRSAGISPDVATYNILIHSMVVRGYVDEANGIVSELIRRGFVPSVLAFTDVIGGFSKKGDFQEAFLLWHYMADLRVQPDVVTCSALLHGYCRAQRMGDAMVLFNKLLDAGLKPDVVLYNTLIHGYCSVGDVEKACELIGVMVQRGMVPNESTFVALVVGLEGKTDVEDSEKHASMLLEEIFVANSEM
ncbi:Pentatricopeptide repeat-containing protein [Raphanus sativus]|uniref:Pentatricopeptide repeat-containing protein At2g19280 n=1 Tax=Raphanus sativus TaxID=3726 RepID=A0A6J0JV91_RAPSA|nr:pentatricopeptide repeat-containing protein At2g19280 [Raphanus sativus]KAJ4888961.1 Pentatricopeptide repeat-containing protein [Raphanus sativus]